MTDTNHLHLSSLSIGGFRGIDALTIPRLGRVTLLAGKNGVGKTTVLDAVRVYAARGMYPTLSRLLLERDEEFMTADEDGTTSSLDWELSSTAGTPPKRLVFQLGWGTALNNSPSVTLRQSTGMLTPIS